MPVHITLQGGEPQTQYSIQFLQGMVNRMLVSYHKYGAVSEAIEAGVDPLASAQQRIRKYWDTGNTEYLMDASNYIMMEFMHPSHTKAHYDAASRSPGRVLRDGRITDAHSGDIRER